LFLDDDHSDITQKQKGSTTALNRSGSPKLQQVKVRNHGQYFEACLTVQFVGNVQGTTK